jgi:hypothetical protein
MPKYEETKDFCYQVAEVTTFMQNEWVYEGGFQCKACHCEFLQTVHYPKIALDGGDAPKPDDETIELSLVALARKNHTPHCKKAPLSVRLRLPGPGGILSLGDKLH